MKKKLVDLINQAITLNGQGHFSEAERCYRKVLASDAGNVHALQGLSIVRAQTGRLDEALQLISRACANQPGDFLLHYNKAKILEKLEKEHEAAACYEKVICMQPNFIEAHDNRIYLLKNRPRV